MTEPHRGTGMLERHVTAGRLAKAGQRLKFALGHQRCQGGAMQGICHDQPPLSHCSTWLARTTTRAVVKLPIGWSTVRPGAINP